MKFNGYESLDSHGREPAAARFDSQLLLSYSDAGAGSVQPSKHKIKRKIDAGFQGSGSDASGGNPLN